VCGGDPYSPFVGDPSSFLRFATIIIGLWNLLVK